MQTEMKENNIKSCKPGKYLTFCLGGEIYGIEILRVQEIIGLMKITSIPNTPDNVRGVINLRGKVISVVDLRVKFGMSSIENTSESCIVVVEVRKAKGSVVLGLLVDNVEEVLNIGQNEIEETPSFGTDVSTDFISGMGKKNDKVIIILDMDLVFSNEELKSIEKS